MKLLSREKRLLNFIDIFGAATTSQIQKLFYSEKSTDKCARIKAQTRLKMLFDNKYIKRIRSDINSEYIYYQKKTQFLNHQILLVDVYLYLLHIEGDILEFTPEIVFADIRPDAKVVFDDYTFEHTFLVEVHRGFNPFDQQKYEDFYYSKVWKEYFEVFPKILVVSDRKIQLKPSKIPFVIVPYSLEGIENILK